MHARILDSIDARTDALPAAPGPRPRSLRQRDCRAAAERFSEAFDRWRQLYEGARAQLMEANRKSEMHGLSAQERRMPKLQQAQANEQLALAERGRPAAARISTPTAIWRRRASCPATIFRGLPLYAYRAAVGTGRSKGQPIFSARVFLRLPSSVRAA